ncbi:MAG: methyltransferase domain-containing protein [Caldilineaceae bacterium]|nr:methyltransferase domain-containing protein [Caldilineaceae bacterium]
MQDQGIVDMADSSLDWDLFRDTAVGRYLLKQEQGFIERALAGAPVTSTNILELACCTGRVSEPLRSRGFSVVGVELDPYALDVYRRHHTNGLLVRGNVLELPFGDNCFDCILAIQCSSYFEPNIFLLECHRVLTSGGILILDVTNRRNYKRMLKHFLRGKSTYRVADTLSFSQWLHFLEAHQFSIQALHGYNWPPFPPENAQFSNSKLVDVAAYAEGLLQLRRLPALSPWLLIAATKRPVQVGGRRKPPVNL